MGGAPPGLFHSARNHGPTGLLEQWIFYPVNASTRGTTHDRGRALTGDSRPGPGIRPGIAPAHQRKALVADRADAFVALTGGFGPLDALFEILTRAHLGIHTRPIGLLNVGGFFDPLPAWVRPPAAKASSGSSTWACWTCSGATRRCPQ
jgi:hypothetical protein